MLSPLEYALKYAVDILRDCEERRDTLAMLPRPLTFDQTRALYALDWSVKVQNRICDEIEREMVR